MKRKYKQYSIIFEKGIPAFDKFILYYLHLVTLRYKKFRFPEVLLPEY